MGSGTEGEGEARRFDLNIERVLENWTLAHALREIIANALDEQALTDSDEIQIFKDGRGAWHIRDWGRGIRYEHLTQNEDKEKLRHPDQVVGKFGVGLKDALATFDRHRVKTCIRSRHGDITTGKASKHGFDEIATLHALIAEPSDPLMVGTDVVVDGVSDRNIDDAKSLFLRYSGDRLIESTPVGQIFERTSKSGKIYVNGLKVAEEETFLFSYNITATTKRLRAALNRERTNVGRTAYTDRVKAILLAAESVEATEALATDLEAYQSGRGHDETEWLDVAVHACKVLNARAKVVFVSASELMYAAESVSRARGDGYRIVVVPDNVRRKLGNAMDITGDPVRDLTQYRSEWNESFQFSFVDPADLTPTEKAVFNKTDRVLALRGGKPRIIRAIAISETMRLAGNGFEDVVGVWEEAEGRIVVKRSQLGSLAAFAGTLLHEVAHAVSRAEDVSQDFERALTSELGSVASSQLRVPADK